MELGAFKPLLTALAMPPLSLLLLALLGLLLINRHKRTGITLVSLALAVLWLLGCPATTAWLANNALTQYPTASPAQIRAGKAQAIVILGGGVSPAVPEYGGEPQPGDRTFARLRYGVWLGKQTGLPVAVTGGVGWGTASDGRTSEADVIARIARLEYGLTPRWLEGQSRDTTQNAMLLAPILKRDGIRHVALVTDSWHMNRSVIAFERTGLTVTAAPIGYIPPDGHGFTRWLPSAGSLQASQLVLKEWLGIQAGRWLPV
ncbi:MAG: YdcF family protein [Pseudomonadota bacterium]